MLVREAWSRNIKCRNNQVINHFTEVIAHFDGAHHTSVKQEKIEM